MHTTAEILTSVQSALESRDAEIARLIALLPPPVPTPVLVPVTNTAPESLCLEPNVESAVPGNEITVASGETVSIPAGSYNYVCGAFTGSVSISSAGSFVQNGNTNFDFIVAV